MSINYNFSDRITVTENDDSKFKSLVLSRYKEIFKQEDTAVKILILNSVSYNNTELFLEELEKADTFKIESFFSYEYTGNYRWDENIESDDLLFCLADYMENADDEYLKTHQYSLYNFADSSETGDGILATYKNENGLAIRGAVPYEEVAPQDVKGAWMNESDIVVWDSTERSEEDFNEVYPYIEKAKKYFDIEVSQKYKSVDIFNIKSINNIDIKSAMEALYDIEKCCFSGLDKVENKFYSCNFEMFNVIFDFEKEDIVYQIARA